MDDTTQKLIQGLQSRVAALENDSGGIESYEMFSTNVSWPVDIAVSGANYVVTTGETPPFGTLDNTSFTVGTADTLPTHVGFLLRDHEASTSTAVWIFGGDSTDCSVFVPSPVLLEPAAKYWPIVPVARRSGGVLGGATTTYARLQRVYARFALAMANAQSCPFAWQHDTALEVWMKDDSNAHSNGTGVVDDWHYNTGSTYVIPSASHTFSVYCANNSTVWVGALPGGYSWGERYRLPMVEIATSGTPRILNSMILLTSVAFGGYYHPDFESGDYSGSHTWVDGFGDTHDLGVAGGWIRDSRIT